MKIMKKLVILFHSPPLNPHHVIILLLQKMDSTFLQLVNSMVEKYSMLPNAQPLDYLNVTNLEIYKQLMESSQFHNLQSKAIMYSFWMVILKDQRILRDLLMYINIVLLNNQSHLLYKRHLTKVSLVMNLAISAVSTLPLSKLELLTILKFLL